MMHFQMLQNILVELCEDSLTCFELRKLLENPRNSGWFETESVFQFHNRKCENKTDLKLQKYCSCLAIWEDEFCQI